MSESVKAVSQDVEGVPVAAPFHDHRWHRVGGEPDRPDAFLCDECGVVWSI